MITAIRCGLLLFIVAHARSIPDPPDLPRCESAGVQRLACRADVIALEQWRLMAARDAREQWKFERVQKDAKAVSDANAYFPLILLFFAGVMAVVGCVQRHTYRGTP